MSRIIYGMRIVIYVVLLTIYIGASMGVFLGLIAGYHGGIVDHLVMRMADTLLCFPATLLEHHGAHLGVGNIQYGDCDSCGGCVKFPQVGRTATDTGLGWHGI